MRQRAATAAERPNLAIRESLELLSEATDPALATRLQQRPALIRRCDAHRTTIVGARLAGDQLRLDEGIDDP